MAVGNIAAEAAKSIVGGLAKAKIEIEDNRVNEIKVIDIVNNKQKKLLFNDKANFMESVDNDKVTKRLTELGLQKQFNAAGSKKIYTVRFNPSELSINAVGGGKVAKTNFDDTKESKVEYVAMEINIQLTVRLVFDDMRVTDSFMNEIATPVNGAHKIYHAAKETRNSVQAQVEGFIGAMRNAYTRRVAFVWGNLRYEGVLNYMNSEYTMFSIHGRPVRAHVDIGILCSDKSMDGTNMGQWEPKFKAAFDSDGQNLETAGQNVGNLININL